MKTKINAAVIGLGVGEKHIEGYANHPDCNVTAICDFSEEKLHDVKLKYPGLIYTTEADEIINNPDIDVVSIASYDNYHYEQIIQAIQQGKHIFVEKPLCLFEHESQKIYELLKKNKGVRLSSNLILRKSPRFELLKELIAKGDMGDLFYIEGDYNYGRLSKITNGWRGKIDFYSVIYGGGVHIVDLICWLTEDTIIDVAAYGNSISSKETSFRFNDMVVCILKFKSGMIGKISANFGCVFPHFHALSVYGTKATFQNGFDRGIIYNSREPNIPPITIDAEYPGIHKGDLINSFINSILYGTEADVSCQDVFNTMSICFAIEKATYQEGFVSVNYLK